MAVLDKVYFDQVVFDRLSFIQVGVLRMILEAKPYRDMITEANEQGRYGDENIPEG